MSEEARYNLMIVGLVLGVIAVWGVFFAIFGLAGAIILTVTIALAVGALLAAGWYFEVKRTALPANVLTAEDTCENCTHTFKSHYLVNYTGDPFDGGQMLCLPSWGTCPCKSKWTVEITAEPEPEVTHDW